MKNQELTKQVGKAVLSKGGIKNGIALTKIWCTKYSPEILTGLGVAGMCSAVVTSGIGTLKASEKIKTYKEDNELETLTKKEIVKETWKCYIPTAALVLSSSACIIGATKIKSDRMSALATALAMSEKASEELIEKAKQVVGVEKVEEIKKEVKQDKVNKAEESTFDLEENIIETGDGTDLFYDEMTGRLFHSCQNAIREGVNRVNMEMMSSMCCNANELYSEINLPNVVAGKYLGWNIDDGLIDVRFDSMLTPSGRPCVTVDYCPKVLRKVMY